jgi:hypothetical protein
MSNRQNPPKIAVRLAVLWCRLMHDAPMWPMYGTYQCRVCARSYPVPWAAGRVLRRARLVTQAPKQPAESGA